MHYALRVNMTRNIRIFGAAIVFMAVLPEGILGMGHKNTGAHLNLPGSSKSVKASVQNLATMAFGCEGLDAGDVNITCQHETLEARFGTGLDCAEKVPVKTKVTFVNCPLGYAVVEDYRVINCKFPGKWDNEMFTCDEIPTTEATTTKKLTTKPTTHPTTKSTIRTKSVTTTTKPATTTKPLNTTPLSVNVSTTTVAGMTTTTTLPTVTNPTTTTVAAITTQTSATTTATVAGRTTTTSIRTTSTAATAPNAARTTIANPAMAAEAGITTPAETITDEGHNGTANATAPTNATTAVEGNTTSNANVSTPIAAGNTTPTFPPPTLTSGYGFPFENKTFKAILYQTSVNKARKWCQDQKADLPTFSTKAKLDHLLKVSNSHSFLVGMNDSATDGTFLNNDGTPTPTFVNFTSRLYGVNGAACARYNAMASYGEPFGLVDIYCDHDMWRWVICEKSA